MDRDEQATALRRAALEMAIEYHARAAEHQSSRGPRSPATVTATAEDFLMFLQRAADRAGVSEDLNG
jgi:hypothetical protein